MVSVTDIIILFSFLVEVFILLKLEKILWGTHYTPLNFLMIPYTVVLLINIALPPDLGFVPFYYPSIFVWSVGLIFFFMPSLLLGIISKKDNSMKIIFDDPYTFKPLYVIGFVLLFLSLFYVYNHSFTSENLIGSDEFADETLAKGIWAHVREALLSILILSIFFFKKNKIIFYFLIVGILIVSIVYQVKSWIIIPVLAGIIMRLFVGKTVLKFRNLIYIILGGIGVFFLSYYLILVFSVEEGEFDIIIAELIYKHFIHYVISGTTGLSIDFQSGFLEDPTTASIFAPFINFAQLFIGGEYVSPTNPVYLDSGWAGTNVRTFFGTLYVNLGFLGSTFYVFFFSTLLYVILSIIKKNANLWALSFYGLMCALLAMGWFEFYFFHFTIIEIPLFSLIYIILMYKIKWKIVD